MRRRLCIIWTEAIAHDQPASRLQHPRDFGQAGKPLCIVGDVVGDIERGYETVRRVRSRNLVRPEGQHEEGHGGEPTVELLDGDRGDVASLNAHAMPE